MIARQAQGVRAGEVIAKLAEDTYFMRVDNCRCFRPATYYGEYPK
jgi:hypothetical protein